MSQTFCAYFYTVLNTYLKTQTSIIIHGTSQLEIIQYILFIDIYRLHRSNIQFPYLIQFQKIYILFKFDKIKKIKVALESCKYKLDKTGHLLNRNLHRRKARANRSKKEKIQMRKYLLQNLIKLLCRYKPKKYIMFVTNSK